MSNLMKQDMNYNVSETRTGPPLGAVIPVSIASSDSLNVLTTAWYRLMPSGNDADKLTETELALGALPAWFLPCNFNGWFLKILNAGYNEQPPITIDHIDENGNCTLQKRIFFYDSLPDDVEWVIYPDMLFPLSININSRGGGATDFADIGWLSRDTFAVANDDVRRIDSINKESLQAGRRIPTTEVDRIVFRFSSLTSGVTQSLGWGETDLDIG